MKRTTYIGAAVLAVIVVGLLIAPLWISGSPYIMHLAITAFFYAILAASWSLLAGYAGQFSFAHMAFMAIGAYTAALYGTYFRVTSAPTNLCSEMSVFGWNLVLLDPIGVTQDGGLNCLDIAKQSMPAGTVIIEPSLWWGVLLGILVGGLWGFLIGALVLRLRSTYLALFTIGFSEIVRAVLSAELDITQGQSGLEMTPLFPGGLTVAGMTFDEANKIPPYYAMLALFLICMVILGWIVISRFGLFIRSIREDEEAAAALGVHTVRYKVMVFTVTAMMAAAAGAVQGHYIGIITPNILIILQMSLVIAMAVIGGLENIYAAASGAIVLLFALELLRNSFDIGPVSVDMTTWRLVFFGLVLMLTLRFFRNGLIYPIIMWISRRGMEEETVARRNAASATNTEAGG
ncbi:MAG: branched-chain amino acid ABC transporter permease [Caldilineaceae bacterium]|nr:branched-chain amino acid ABC transporter permease [Caldilineaceae bacterium]